MPTGIYPDDFMSSEELMEWHQLEESWSGYDFDENLPVGEDRNFVCADEQEISINIGISDNWFHEIKFEAQEKGISVDELLDKIFCKYFFWKN